MLVLTARNRTEERIAGLDAGADDYLGKPFDLAEVEARLRALVRRAQGTEDIVQLGQPEARPQGAPLLRCDGAPLDLPAREFEVLWELMSPPAATVSKRDAVGQAVELRRIAGRQRAGGLHLAPAQEARRAAARASARCAASATCWKRSRE